MPIGTEVLGSARAQGFITQQVTHRLNAVCAIAIGLMLVESIRSWSLVARSARMVRVVLVVLISAMLVGLITLHPALDGLIDLENRRVLDSARFYQLHRIYLWLSTFQWLAAWVWLYLSVRAWKVELNQGSGVKT